MTVNLRRTLTIKCAAAICASTLMAAASFRFAVIGDTGTGGKAQYQVGERLADTRRSFPFESVLMLGDNLYGSQSPKDFETKFELPYAALLDAGVRFFAVLGNHDEFRQRIYQPFHMDGRSYYTFEPHPGVRFFGLDSNHVDRIQLAWLDAELAKADGAWKFVYFHHPIYSSGARHGSNLPLRKALEPILVKHGVAAVFAGHDHFYERIKPQKGVQYFVVGGSSKLRAANVLRTELTAKAFDRDNSFLLVEIDGDQLRFRAITRTGAMVDEGTIAKPAPHVGRGYSAE